MQSGVGAARNIAESYWSATVLPRWSRPSTKASGIVAGMTTVMCLFLARVLASILTILASPCSASRFPSSPRKLRTSIFTVGIPALLLAFWAKAGAASRRSFAVAGALRNSHRHRDRGHRGCPLYVRIQQRAGHGEHLDILRGSSRCLRRRTGVKYREVTFSRALRRRSWRRRHFSVFIAYSAFPADPVCGAAG